MGPKPNFQSQKTEFSVLHPVHILTPFLKYEYLKAP